MRVHYKLICLVIVFVYIVDVSNALPLKLTRKHLHAGVVPGTLGRIHIVPGSSQLCLTPEKFSGDNLDDETREAYFNRDGVWNDPKLSSLESANKAWSSRMTAIDPNYFTKHKIGHAPKILWIGCSDSRVPANEIIGEPPGNVFVHRNIANQVVHTDFNCMSVVQYVVDVLQVKHIVVCGHYDCGGVKAALTNTDHQPPLENWLSNIRDTYRLHKRELTAIDNTLNRQRRLIELNVVEQCLNIYKTGSVQRRRIATHLEKDTADITSFTTPQIHAFVYEPTNGDLKRLNVDFKQYLTDLGEVYDLYQLPEDSSSNK